MSFSLLRLALFVTLICFNGTLHAEVLSLQPRVRVSATAVKLQAPTQEWLRKHQVIRVGVWGVSQPPIAQGMLQGRFEGIAADYLNVIQNSLQVKFEPIYFEDSDAALAALAQHDIQMLAAWSAERWPTPNAVATAPWLLDESVLITRSEDRDLLFSKLNSIGVVSHEQTSLLLQLFPKANLTFFPQYDNALNAVSLGQVEAAWLNRTTANYLRDYLQLKGLNMAPSKLPANLNLSFGIDRQLPELHEAVESALQQMTLDNRLLIASGWGVESRSVVSKNPLGLTDSEEEWLRNKKHIDVLISKQAAPLDMDDAQSEAKGFVADLIYNLSQRFNLPFVIHDFNDDKDFIRLQQRYPDALVVNHWQQSVSSDSSAHAVPILTSPMVVVMSSLIARPTNFDQLKGERLALSTHNPLFKWLETWYPTIELVPFSALDQAVQLLKEGKVRGIILPQFIGNHLILKHSRDNLRIAIALPVPAVQLIMTSRNPQNIALDIVRKAVDGLLPANLIQIAAHWYDLSSDEDSVARPQIVNLLALGLILLLICFLSGWWIRRLYRALRRGEQSQASLIDQLRFTQTLIDNIPVAIYARDRAGKLLHFNPSWSKTVGRPGKSLLGTTIRDIDSMELQSREKLDRDYQQVLDKGETVYWTDNFVFDGESRYLTGWTVPWYDRHNQVNGLIGGWIDLSEKEALIASLQETKEQLEQARASKAAFMQSMGHEIRTPLNAIIGLLEIELQTSNAKLSENLPLVWEAACDLLSLFGDVFDIFRAQNQNISGSIRSVNLPQLIHSTVALYQLQAEKKGLRIEIEADVKNERYKLDSLLLIRIFSSLLRNAIKHSSGGCITVALFQGRQETAEDLLPLVIEISNQGEFLTDTQNATESEAGWRETGYSLAACQRMAESAGAEIAIESDDEEGTIISYYFHALPLAFSKPVPVSFNSRQLNILIVDDYAPGRSALRQQLTHWGHLIQEAENGEQALQRLKQYPELELLITDCTMPVMDGFMLTRRIRELERQQQSKTLPIFGLTALTGDEAQARGQAAGMSECLLKPLTPSVLQQTLQRYFPAVKRPQTLQQAAQTPELLAELRDMNHQDAAQLKRWLEDGNRLETGRMAHRIRGGAHLLQDESLLKVCKQLELACETDCAWDDIEKLAATLFETLQRTNDKIDAKLNGENSDNSRLP
ncbi:MAG: transporter substrate-binding domain-containing protein [Pantoea dispersa]|nr:transporter substrate-binding domain-containing protein [Pantoea dispersa]MBZ6392510.1 transporter substrate-binding domain-containing protein [Pantoea dispersa]